MAVYSVKLKDIAAHESKWLLKCFVKSAAHPKLDTIVNIIASWDFGSHIQPFDWQQLKYPKRLKYSQSKICRPVIAD